jgi:hypothetical protein
VTNAEVAVTAALPAARPQASARAFWTDPIAKAGAR